MLSSRGLNIFSYPQKKNSYPQKQLCFFEISCDSEQTAAARNCESCDVTSTLFYRVFKNLSTSVSRNWRFEQGSKLFTMRRIPETHCRSIAKAHLVKDVTISVVPSTTYHCLATPPRGICRSRFKGGKINTMADGVWKIISLLFTSQFARNFRIGSIWKLTTIILFFSRIAYNNIPLPI
jgi:hypothetical protein